MTQFSLKLIIGLFIALPCFLANAADSTNPLNPIKKPTKVTIETSMGEIKLELYPDKAPHTVANFLTYVDAGFYDGTVFHRVIPYFMIQGGGFDKLMVRKKTKPPVVNEADNGLLNFRGTIAMARTNDPNSATSQFFINVEDNRSLNKSMGNAGYTVFGKIIDGMPIADRISEVKTGIIGGMRDGPLEKVIIKRIYRN